MENMNYDELLHNECIKNVSKRVRFNIKTIFYYIDALKNEGVSQREIEELTGIQIKRDHICIFDISK